MEFEKTVLLRKSIRSYRKDKQVAEKDLQKILLAGMAAPVSRKDYNSIIFTVVQDKELLRKMDLVFEGKENLLYGFLQL